MQFEQDNDTYIIYLEKDERIMNANHEGEKRVIQD